MRDQLITARVYANIAQSQGHYDLVHDLKLRIKEHSGTVGDANLDAQLPSGYRTDFCFQSFRHFYSSLRRDMEHNVHLTTEL